MFSLLVLEGAPNELGIIRTRFVTRLSSLGSGLWRGMQRDPLAPFDLVFPEWNRCAAAAPGAGRPRKQE